MKKLLTLILLSTCWVALIACAQTRESIPDDLKAAIRYEIRFERTFRSGGRLSSCVSPEWDTLRPDHHRSTGWEYRSVPGLHSAIYLIDTGDAHSKARSIALAQMSYLARLGFYREASGFVATAEGKKPAKEFRLTAAGLASMYPREVPAPCFLVGVRDVAEIVAIQPLDTSGSLGEQFSALVRTQVVNVPPWTETPEARALFPEIRDMTAPRTEAIRAWKYGDIWVTGLRQQAVEQFFHSQRDALQAQLRAWNREYAFPPEPEAKLNEVKRGQLTDVAEKPSESLACFPLRLVAGGDARSTRSRSVFDFYDIKPSARQATGTAHTVGQLNVLVALANAEAASIERIDGAVAWGAPSDKGVRFIVGPNSRKFVESNCLPLGTVSINAVTSFLMQPKQVTLLLHAHLKDVPRITRDAAAGIPALATILNEGAVFQGALMYRGKNLSDTDQAWHLSGMKLIAPNMLFYSFPQGLSSLLPQTAGAARQAISAELRYRAPKGLAFHPE